MVECSGQDWPFDQLSAIYSTSSCTGVRPEILTGCVCGVTQGHSTRRKLDRLSENILLAFYMLHKVPQHPSIVFCHDSSRSVRSFICQFLAQFLFTQIRKRFCLNSVLIKFPTKRCQEIHCSKCHWIFNSTGYWQSTYFQQIFLYGMRRKKRGFLLQLQYISKKEDLCLTK